MSTTGPKASGEPKRERPPIRVDHGRPPTDAQLAWACEMIDRLGAAFLEALTEAIGEVRGRPGSVSARHALIALALLVTEDNHQFEYTNVASQLVSCTDVQREAIGLGDLPTHRAYHRVRDKCDRIHAALRDGFDVCDGERTFRADLDWFMSALAQAAIPDDLPTSRSRAVDGTDWETCGRWLREDGAEYEGEAPPDTGDDLEQHRKKIARIRRRARKANFELGPDGRPIYTRDRDARAGHRSNNSEHRAGPYNGYETHLAVQVRDHAWNGRPDQITPGPDVPAVITGAALTPAGAHRADAVVPLLIKERVRHQGEEVGLRHVMWDRGYSILDDARTHAPLRLHGIEPVFDLSTAQRKYQPTMEGVLWIDGQPFSIHVPERLRNLPRAGRNASTREREVIEALYNERARWRYSTLAGPDTDGYIRMQCPFCAGRLRSRALRQRKVARSAPLADLPEGTTRCCAGVIRVEPALLRAFQAAGMPFGTSAWSTVYGWRNLVETGNCYVGGLYVDLSRKYTKLMGLAKRKFILAFVLAGANRYITTQWRRKKEEEARRAAEARKTRKRRRKPEQTLQGIVAAAKGPDLDQEPAAPAAETARPTTPIGKTRSTSRTASTRLKSAPPAKPRHGAPGRSPVSRT